MAKGAMFAQTPVTATRTVLLAEYSFVRLNRPVTAGEVTYPAGSRGVIVHRHDDGLGYEVEFEQPAFRVITLTASDIQPDREPAGNRHDQPLRHEICVPLPHRQTGPQ